MTTVEITLSLPDELAREAAARGVLEPEALAALIQAEVMRRKTEKLFAIMDDLATLDLPPLSDDELNAEIYAARAKRRADNARDS